MPQRKRLLALSLSGRSTAGPVHGSRENPSVPLRRTAGNAGGRVPRHGAGAAECSDAPRDVCELALAHVNSDRAEAPYRRTDLFVRRRLLMQEWAAYVAADRSGK